MLGGVAAGLAVRLGVRVSVVRLLWLLAVLLGGLGLVAYMAAWVLVVRRGEDEAIAQRVLGEARDRRAVGAAAVVVGVSLVAVAAATHRVAGGILWPVLPSALGGLLVWRGASVGERRGLQTSISLPLVRVAGSRGWGARALRVGVGAAAVVVGLNVLASSNQSSGTRFGPVGQSSLLGALIGLVVMGAGLLILLTPWWVHTVRELAEERRARHRAQARADVADHLHDSVLQMLALIQRAADDPAEVTRLARKTERELRGWLFGESPADGESFASRVRALQHEVEGDYAVRVEVVSVGDGPLDDGLVAMLAAAREAVINAAKWSGAPEIRIYAEVSATEAALYVRDRGRGFDPAAVGADHHGVAHSIIERLTRVGGEARVRSAPGEGTEVALELRRGAP